MSPSKFAMPVSAHWLKRPRLYAVLEELGNQSVVWFSAAAGCGKTVLAASYLEARGFSSLWYRFDRRDADPGTLFHYLRVAACEFGIRDAASLPPLTGEYAGGEAVFARNFAEILFAGTPENFVLVLDNFEELPGDAPTQALLAMLLESVPDDRAVFVLSRQLPPATLARLRIDQRLTLLDESRLCLTLDETRELLAIWSGKSSNDILEAEELYRRTGGWLAGTILTLQSYSDDSGPAVSATSAQIAIFDYFGHELLAGLSTQVRHFLLTTALPPQFDITLAAALSGITDSAPILDNLLRCNLFLYREQGGTYRYHPLFHQLLVHTAEQEWSADELSQRRLQTAELLLASREVDSALSLLETVGAWPRFIEVLLETAPALMNQGRHRELDAWLQRIPGTLRDGLPWLIFWRATALLPTEYGVSYTLYAGAYDAFRAQDDGAFGTVLAWIGAVDAIIYSLSDLTRLDDWLVRLEQHDLFSILDDNPQLQGQLVSRAMSILTLRKPDHPALHRWQEKAEASVRHLQDVNQRVLSGFYLVTHRVWAGELDKAETFIDALIEEPITMLPPLAATTYQLGRTWLAWTLGEKAACTRNLVTGLARAEESGVSVWWMMLLLQGVTNELIYGNIDAAEAYYDQMGPLASHVRDMDRVYYYLDHAWLELSRGDAVQALDYQRRTVCAAEDFGAVYGRAEAYFGMAQVYHELEEPELAQQYLQQAQELGRIYGSWSMTFQCGLATAYFALDAGDEIRAVDALRPVLEQALHQGVVCFNGWRPSFMARLSALALRHDICRDLVQTIIHRYRLVPPTAGPDADWPWPVRIYTLGHFALEVGGNNIDLAGNKHRRPCELLKLLIAADSHGIAEDYLADLLWPEIEGDAAIRNLRTNLHRLRKLLAQDAAVTVIQRRVAINPQVCWSDVQALIRLLKDLPTTPPAILADRAERLLALMSGPFLPEEENSLIIHHRTELQRCLLKGLAPLITRLQAVDHMELAEELSLRAALLEKEPGN